MIPIARLARRARNGGRLAASAMGVLLLATRLAAQTQPMPELPPEPAPEPGPDVESAATAKDPQPVSPTARDLPARPRPRPWDYAFGVGAGWDSNIDFVVPDGPRGAAVTPRAALARAFWGPRGQARVTAAGRWTGYPQHTNLDRYYTDLGLDGSYRSSPTTDWRIKGSYGFGYSDSSRMLVEQGVVLPLVKTRSVAGALGLSQKIGRRTSLRIDGRYYRTEFDSPGLIDGESVRGTVGLERHVSNRSTVAIQYSLEDVLSDQAGRAYLTHFGSLQWTRLLSPRSALLLEGGASYTPDAARAGLERQEAFFGGASFSRQVKSSSFTLFVRREVTPAFGIGVSRLDLRAGLGAAVPLGRAWELRMSATHTQPDTPEGAAFVYPSTDAYVALGRRLGRHVELSAEARYRRRGAATAVPMIEAFQAGFFLTLLSPSGATIAPAPGR
jgi:putative beta-barrel porin BBP2